MAHRGRTLGAWMMCLLLGSAASAFAANNIALPLTYETDDYLYYTKLAIGTPGVLFRLVVDTGSANLWVPSSTCSNPLCTQRLQYNPSKSTTSKVLGPTLPITYGGVSITVTLASDMISIPTTGNGASSSISTFEQRFGMAVQMDGPNATSTAEQPWDGLIGMGLPALAAGNVQVPVLSMVQQGLITRPMFGLYLVHNESAEGAGGELTLDGWNADRVQGEITWVDVVNSSDATTQGYWSVPLKQIQLRQATGSSSAAAGVCSSGGSAGCIGILDSGTSQLFASLDQAVAMNAALGGVPSVKQLPFGCQSEVQRILSATQQALNSNNPTQAADQVCDNLYGAGSPGLGLLLCNAVQTQLAVDSGSTPSAASFSQAQQQGVALCDQLPYAINVTFDCQAVPKLPDIAFSIGGSVFAVTPNDYAYQDPRDLNCYSGIAALEPLPPNTWILGDAFMHNYYTVFDFGAAVAGGDSGGASSTGSSGGPRVGIGMLTADEEAVAADLYKQGLASKHSGALSHTSAVGKLLNLLLAPAVAVILLAGALET